VVKAFVREPYEWKRFSAANLDLMNQTIDVGKMIAIAFPLTFLITNLGTLAVIWLGGLQVIGGRLTIGELVAFQGYLLMATFPIMMLGMILAMVSQASASADRVFEILDTRSEVTEKLDAADLPQIEGRVTFNSVWFSYYGEKGAGGGEKPGKRKRTRMAGGASGTGGMMGMGGMSMNIGGAPPAPEPEVDDWVLKDVSFVAEPGQVVALLGATGSGKSTIINLLPRFYDVTRGDVNIDGIDIRGVTLDSLRSQIGIVMQETTLFTGTIRENISYGRPEAPLEEVVTAAKTAEADEFIQEFADGYDTQVGERGAMLSGGQKQRIAIARALLLDPRILILDDSTSSVDVETEYRIQQALEKLMVSTVQNADEILVLDGGSIAAQGKHQDLMRDSAIYAEIYSSQLQSDCELMPELCDDDLEIIDTDLDMQREVA